MATLECSPEQALSQMVTLLRTAEFDRAEFSTLFEFARRGDRLLACKRYIDGIEVLMRRKLNPEEEIVHAYQVLTGDSAPVTIKKVLMNLENSTRLKQILRRQACRLLVHDSNAEISLSSLEDIAICGDAGRLTALDFLVTRRKPLPEHAQLAVKLVNEMSNQKVILENSRRCEYMMRVLRLTNTTDELSPKLPESMRLNITGLPSQQAQPLELIVSATDIKKNISQLQALRAAELAQWLKVLRRASTDANRSHTDKSRYIISNVLGNLARTFQQDPIVVEILAVALDLEAMAKEPSEYIFDKLQRTCVATLKYGGSAYSVLALGLALCAKRISIHPDNTTSKDHDGRLLGAASILKKLSDWKPLVDAVMDFRDRQSRPVIAQLLVPFINPTADNSMGNNHGAGRQKDIDRLMRVALQGLLGSQKERVRLHEVYVLNFGACFDEQEIRSYIDDPKLDVHTRATAAAIWAQVAPNAAVAYKRCKCIISLLSDLKVTNRKPIEALERLLQIHAFVDISGLLGLPLMLHGDNKPIVGNELTIALSTARYYAPPLQGINIAYQAFQLLRHVGDHFDAYCALQTMLLRAHELTNDTGVRFRAYRRALARYMSNELQLPASMIQTALFDKYGYDELLNDGLDELVESVSTTVLTKPHAEALEAFEQEYEELHAMLSNDPRLGIANDSAMAVPPLAIYQGKVPSTIKREPLKERVSNLVCSAQSMLDLNWIDELRLSEKMMSLSCIATTIRVPQSLSKKIDARAAEKIQGRPILAMREHLSQHKASPNKEESEFTETPTDLICISLSFDTTNTLVVTRREQRSTTVTVRLPESRTASFLTSHKNLVNYNQAVAEITTIIDEARDVEVSEDSSSERERFWKLQYALDDRMQKVLVSIQRSWIAGFQTIFSSQSHALEVSDEMLNGLSSTIQSHIPTLRPNQLALSMALSACMRDAAKSDSFDQLQDILYALFDNLVFQGASISVDEINVPKLMADIQKQVQRLSQSESASTSASASASRVDPKHIILVCDRKASVIPWEMLPVLQRGSVTRAISLNQVAEWIKQRGKSSETEQKMSLSDKVTVILNPQGNLPRTQEKFDTEFRLRGWKGFIGTTPTRDQFVEAFVNSSSLVYVGHGSGSMLAEPIAIRRLFLTQTGVYLFGCSSVAVQYPFFNKDIMTSYAVAGSRVIMGTLWNVKDKDCNRFTAEFLSRVFDDKEHLGKALWEARKACMLPYLTSAAWVIYGLP